MKIEDYNSAPAKTEKEVTVKDVLGDKKQSSLFGEFIKTQPGGQDRAERLFKGESTTDDMQKLAEQKEQFFERQKEVEKISKAFTPEFISKLAGQSPKLEILVKNGGVEGVHGAIVSQLEMLAMREPVRFYTMVDSYNEVLSKADIANEQIKKICELHGITSGEYLKILASTSDEAERQTKLGDMIRGNMGKVKGMRQKTIEKNKAIRDQEVDIESKDIDYKFEIDKLRANYDQELENVGDVLAVSINENASMKKAFMDSLLSEKAPKEEPAGGFKEMRGVMPSEENMKQEWDGQWKEAQVKGTSRGDFEKTYVDGKLGNKKGTWSDIVRKFIMTSVSKF